MRLMAEVSLVTRLCQCFNLQAGGTEDGLTHTELIGLGMPSPPSKMGIKEPPGNLYVEVDTSALRRPEGEVIS